MGKIKKRTLRMHESKRKELKHQKKTSMTASLTLEAALGLTLMLMAFSSILQLFQVMYIQNRMQQALNHAAEEIAAYSYLGEVLPDLFAERDEEETKAAEQQFGEQQDASDVILQQLGDLAVIIGKNGLNEAYLEYAVVKELGTEWLDSTAIVNGSQGLNFTGTLLTLDSHYVDAKVTYQVQLYFLPEGMNRISFTQRCRRRFWTGFIPETKPESEEESGDSSKPAADYVYITKYGTRYHEYKDCSNLKRDIKTVSKDTLDTLTNQSGQKYRLCELCVQETANAYGYVTAEGDCFHNRKDCGALTRYIQEVARETVQDRKLCSVCSKRKKE